MATAIAAKINSASFGVTASVAGNRIRLEGEDFVNLGAGVAGLVEEFENNFDSGQVIEAISGGNSFVEGQLFTVIKRGWRSAAGRI